MGNPTPLIWTITNNQIRAAMAKKKKKKKRNQREYESYNQQSAIAV